MPPFDQMQRGFARNVRAIEVLVDRDAVTSAAAAAGEPWQHYDLGRWCSYSSFDQRPHRMASARCDSYLLTGSAKAHALEVKTNLQRMLASISLQDVGSGRCPPRARRARPGLGLAMGIGIVGTSAHRDAPLWPVWASLAVALTTAAGAIFVYGFDRWTELSTLLLSRTVRLRDVNAPAAAGVAIALLGVLGSVLLSALLSRPTGSSWRGAALVVIAIFGGVLAAGVMFGVRAGRAGLRPCRHSLPASRTGPLRRAVPARQGRRGVGHPEPGRRSPQAGATARG
jgi:hypothetical protein